MKTIPQLRPDEKIDIPLSDFERGNRYGTMTIINYDPQGTCYRGPCINPLRRNNSQEILYIKFMFELKGSNVIRILPHKTIFLREGDNWPDITWSRAVQELNELEQAA